MRWVNELNNIHQSLHTVSTFKTTASGNVVLLVLASLIVFFFFIKFPKRQLESNSVTSVYICLICLYWKLSS